MGGGRGGGWEMWAEGGAGREGERRMGREMGKEKGKMEGKGKGK